jgi:hypothetical protein
MIMWGHTRCRNVTIISVLFLLVPIVWSSLSWHIYSVTFFIQVKSTDHIYSHFRHSHLLSWGLSINSCDLNQTFKIITNDFPVSLFLTDLAASVQLLVDFIQSQTWSSAPAVNWDPNEAGWCTPKISKNKMC